MDPMHLLFARHLSSAQTTLLVGTNTYLQQQPLPPTSRLASASGDSTEARAKKKKKRYLWEALLPNFSLESQLEKGPKYKSPQSLGQSGSSHGSSATKECAPSGSGSQDPLVVGSTSNQRQLDAPGEGRISGDTEGDSAEGERSERVVAQAPFSAPPVYQVRQPCFPSYGA